jgi:hypothetical protein
MREDVRIAFTLPPQALDMTSVDQRGIAMLIGPGIKVANGHPPIVLDVPEEDLRRPTIIPPLNRNPECSPPPIR